MTKTPFPLVPASIRHCRTACSVPHCGSTCLHRPLGAAVSAASHRTCRCCGFKMEGLRFLGLPARCSVKTGHRPVFRALTTPPNLLKFSDYLILFVAQSVWKNDIPEKRGDVADDLLQLPLLYCCSIQSDAPAFLSYFYHQTYPVCGNGEGQPGHLFREPGMELRFSVVYP